jgi:arylsulfatase A-like enzyme
LLTTAALYREQPVQTWDFQRQEDLTAWTLADVASHQLVPGGILLHSGSGSMQLSRTVGIEPGSVHVVRVVATGVHALRLDWAAPFQPFSTARSLHLTTHDAKGGAPDTYEFQVAADRRWVGHVARIRLVLSPLERNPIAVHSVSLVRFLRSESLEAAAAGHAWIVDIDREQRSALLGLPGRSIERELVVPAGGDLHIAYGVWRPVDTTLEEGAIHFRVSMATTEDEPRPVFESRFDLASGEGTPFRWNDAKIELSAYAGKRARLILETTAPSDHDPLRGVPVWGNPIVLGRRSGERPPNVILISLDTLRADRLSLYGHHRLTSPRIDAWARRVGVTFRNAVAAAPWTLPSHVSMLTGLDAISHGVNYDFPAPSFLTMLAEILRQAGYSTVAITGGGFVSPHYGLAQGFDQYRYWSGAPAGELSENVSRVLQWLEAGSDRPFFLFFHTYEIHDPFHPREPYASDFDRDARNAGIRNLKTRTDKRPPRVEDGFVREWHLQQRPRGSTQWAPMSGQQEPDISRRYDSAIAYTDAQLGALLQRVQDVGIEQNTIVVLTSDHGELFGEHGLAGHLNLYEENLLVPLVFAMPGRFAGGRIVQDQVRSVDILPTVLDLIGLPAQADIDGVSLVPLLEGDRPPVVPDAWSYAAASNHGVALRVGNRLKYVYNNSAWKPVRGSERLYRLDEDPGEKQDVTRQSGETEALRQTVRGRLREASGLRVRFANAEATTYSATLTGAFHNPASVKTTDVPCECVTQQGLARVEVTVPASQRFHVVLEDVRGGTLSIAGALQAMEGQRNPAPFLWTIDLAKLRESRTLAFTGTSWEDLEGLHQPDGHRGTSMTVSWEGRRDGLETSSPDLDSALRRQLRALGYAN